eukprot:g12337.t3
MRSSRIALLMLLVRAVHSQVPTSLGADLDTDGNVDGFEYVDCRTVTVAQFGISKAYAFLRPVPPTVCFELCAASSFDYFGVYGRAEGNAEQSGCVCGETEGFLESVEELPAGTCDFGCADGACGGWRSDDGSAADMAIYRLLDEVPVPSEESTEDPSIDFDGDGSVDMFRYLGCRQMRSITSFLEADSLAVSPVGCAASCAMRSAPYFGLVWAGEQTICGCGIVADPAVLSFFADLEAGTCDNQCPVLPGVSCGGLVGEISNVDLYVLSDEEASEVPPDVDGDGNGDGFEYLGCRAMDVAPNFDVASQVVQVGSPTGCFIHCALASYDYFAIFFGATLSGGPTVCVCGKNPDFDDVFDESIPARCENPCPALLDVSCGGYRTGPFPNLSVYRLLDGQLPQGPCPLGSELCGDPHMHGLRGQSIDWAGVDGGWYSLIRDDPASLHVNVRVTAPLPEEFPDRQLVTGVSVLSQGHSIVIQVINPYAVDSFDGCPGDISPCLANGGLRVEVDGVEAGGRLLGGVIRDERVAEDIYVSASNLPVECRQFGGHIIWARMYEEMLQGKRELASESFEDWVLKFENMAAPEWCAKYVAERGLADVQSTHAIFKIETPTVTVRLNVGVDHQGQGGTEETWDGPVLPELDFWQMDVGLDGLDIEDPALSGILGETARPVLDQDGHEIMKGQEAFRGSVEDYRVPGPLAVSFPLFEDRDNKVENDDTPSSRAGSVEENDHHLRRSLSSPVTADFYSLSNKKSSSEESATRRIIKEEVGPDDVAGEFALELENNTHEKHDSEKYAFVQGAEDDGATTGFALLIEGEGHEDHSDSSDERGF